MIVYNRSAFGWRLIFRIHGSAVYRAILPALISVLLYILFAYVYAQEVEYTEDLLHPYAVGVLIATASFLIVFKLNNSYGRFWEACGAVHHMISKWIDATTHTSVYHMQCDHYNQIKPPSFYDYEELNHLNMTRDRERGVDYTAFDYGGDSDVEEEHRRHSSFSGLRNRKKKKSLTGKKNHRGHHGTPNIPPQVRFSKPSGSMSSERNPSPSAPSSANGPPPPGTPIPETPATIQQLFSPDHGDNHHHYDSHDEGRISSFSNTLKSSMRSTTTTPSERDRKHTQKRQRELRSIVKSINYLENEKKQEKANRISTAYPQSSDLSLPHAMGSSGSSHFPEVISEDEDEAAIDAFFEDKFGNNSERPPEDGSPDSLWGRPRLDGNWEKYFTRDKKNPIATFYNPLHPDHLDASGFASMQGGHTPPLFLQELAHLASLLVAVALSTLRNDIEGAESPLAVYVPGEPWPEVDPDLDKPIDVSPFGIKLRTFLSVGKSPEERTLWNATRPLPVIGGVSDAEIRFLQMARGPYAKTQLCWNWLSEFIIREHLAGSLGNVGPPIISRVIQFLGDGMIFYNHARKIMFIPFPFVHSQIVVLFIVAMIPAVPFLMTQYTDEIWLGALLTFGTVLCLAGINEVARELENPFRNIPNELPLVTFQAQVNEALYTMFAGYHPDFFWDGDRVLRQARSARNMKSNKPDDSHSIKTPKKNNRHEAPLVPTDSIHTKSTEEPSDTAEWSSSNTGASNSPVLSGESHTAEEASSEASKKDDTSEITELKRQLAAQAKLIEQLCSKIGVSEDEKVEA